MLSFSKMKRLFVVSIFSIGVVLSTAALASGTPLITGAGGLQATGDDVLAEAVHRLPAEVRAQALAVPGNVMQMATGVLMRRALAAEAEQAQLDRDPRIAAQLRLARERVLAEARLEQIDARGADPAALEKAALTEYRVQPEKFQTPEQIRVRHILIDSRACDAEKRIEQLLQQVRGGADFAALAREHSQDPGSAGRGGDLGFFPRGRMAEEFDNAAFALKQPGEVSGIVRSQFGLHLIKLEERKPAARQPFEKVREALVKDLRERNSRNLRAQATEPILKSMKTDMAAIEAFAKQPR